MAKLRKTKMPNPNRRETAATTKKRTIPGPADEIQRAPYVPNEAGNY